MERQQCRILVFINNCTFYNYAPILSHLEIEYLSVIPRLQPLDQSITKNLKNLHCKAVMQLLDGKEHETIIFSH